MSVLSYQNMQVQYEYFPCPQQKAGNIVLLHSLGLSMEEFDAFIPYFLSTFNVLRYDVLGHGKSELPLVQVTVDTLADQLEYMTRRFFSEAFYIISGPGMGYVATRFCRIFNPSVSGLVMISPQPVYLSHEEKQQVIGQIESTMLNGFHSFKQFLLSHFTINQDPLMISRLAKQLDQVDEHVHLELINSWLDKDFSRDIRDINTPIVVLAGTQDTMFPSSTYGLTANYMKAELVIIPGAAHLVASDNPEASADAVLSFIASIESGKPAEKGFIVRKERIAEALYRGFEHAEAASSQTMLVYLLHTFRIQIGDVDVTTGWNLRKVKSLFLYLLFHGTVTRDEIIDVFWPTLPLDRARNQLRMNLHFLKSLLNQGECEFLHTDRECVFLKKGIQCDATDYINRLKETYNAMLRDNLDIQVAMDILEISPRKLMTHVYDEWYLHFRDGIETQYCALCQWTSERLSTLNRKEDAANYQQMIEELLN